MRIDCKKFLFIGMHNDRIPFFEKAQEFGIVHFIDKSSYKGKDLPDEVQHYLSAIKVLRGLPTLPQEEMGNFAHTDGLVEKILQMKHTMEKLEEEHRMIRLEIERIHVFGDFSLEDINFIEKQGNRKIQYFFTKKGLFDEKSLHENLIKVGSDHGLDYFISISKKAIQYENMIEMNIDESLGKLKERFHNNKQEYDELEESLKKYEKYNEFLHHGLIFKLNKYNLNSAENLAEFTMDGMIFAIEGWVPKNKMDELIALTDELNVYPEEILIESDDIAPTYLENTGAHRVGEDLVHIYDTPSNSDKDPSLWVLLAFSLFFAIIVGDGGYGLVFLGIALYIRYKVKPTKKMGKRVLNLFTILCFTSIAWGLFSSNFFGINFAPESSVRQVSTLNWLAEKKAEYHIEKQDSVVKEWGEKYPELKVEKDPSAYLQKGVVEMNGKPFYEVMNKFYDNILMEIALLIGVIHICLSFLRYLGRNWAGFGWVLFIIGGYLYLPTYLDATSLLNFLFGLDRDLAALEGQYLMVGGLSLALVLSLIQNRFGGVLEIANLIQIFGDILSYLRLYALGLAGSIVAATVNDLASGMMIIFAIPFMILGHSVNMLLAIMGGVIHGLRLNFLEWYHYSFEGGGKMFKPLKILKVEE